VIVQKFGGTSVGGAVPIQQVGGIVKSFVEREPVVVVSAVGGVTDQLIGLGAVAQNEGKWEGELSALVDRHRQILSELGLESDLVDPLLGELERLVLGIALIRELTPRTMDYLLSFGERLSSRIVAAHLTKIGVPARAWDAFDAGLVTDSRNGAARPLESSDARIRERLGTRSELPVVTGFVAKDENGVITTLGRGGSDYTASIFGAALDAEEIQIWTDVDGVMTTDPRIVKDARHQSRLSCAEASELAFYGAKVVHPATMVPAVRKNIPIRVLNTYRPDFEGTQIIAALGADELGVKSITCKKNITVVSIVAPPMALQYGFIERISAAFARHEIVIDVISTSEVSVAITTQHGADLAPVVAELERFSEVSVQHDRSVVSVIGEELRAGGKVIATIFSELVQAGVDVEMISFGATRNNLTVVVKQERMQDVVRALHSRLFES
jgi:aspartate kinase